MRAFRRADARLTLNDAARDGARRVIATARGSVAGLDGRHDQLPRTPRPPLPPSPVEALDRARLVRAPRQRSR